MTEQGNIEAHWEEMLIARAEAAERERDAALVQVKAMREVLIPLAECDWIPGYLFSVKRRARQLITETGKKSDVCGVSGCPHRSNLSEQDRRWYEAEEKRREGQPKPPGPERAPGLPPGRRAGGR